MEEIVVTGSRIPRVELTTAAPVTVLNRTQIESSGRPSIGDILQSIPEQSNAINTQFNNGGDGSTRINLRGLGTPRTLVLVNGRRFVAGGTGADASVDLNSIPTSAIQRIEILKDGASAVYGSDAIAGVVNIITRKDFSGTEISAFSGVSNYGDGVLVDLGATTGQVTDRGNILFSAGFIKQQPVWSGDREFARFQWGLDMPSGELSTIGSSNVPQSRMYVDSPGSAGNAAYQKLLTDFGVTPGPKNTVTFILDKDTGAWRKFRASGVEEAGGDFYNFQPENYLVTPQQRGHLFAVGEYKFSPDVRGYFEASFTNRVSEQKLAPEPLIIGTRLSGGEDVFIDANNPYNPFGVDFVRYRRRLIEFGNRIFREDINTFRLVTGVNGSLPVLSNWTWDVSLNLGRNDATYLKRGTVQLSRLQNALGPGFPDPITGEMKCGVPGPGGYVIDGCVPINLFGGAAMIRPDGGKGSITPEMANYLSFAGTSLGYNQQMVAAANIAGELFRITPTAHMAGVAAGYEFRKESGASIPDPLTAKGDTSGNKSEPTDGSFFVNEGYVELSLPILGQFGEQTQGGKDLLELNAAARFVNYNTFGSNLSYKVGARLSPIQDITLRGTYSTAFRAPSITELYSGQADNFPAVSDPCSGDPKTGTPRPSGGALDDACLAQGVPNAFIDDSKQLRSREGGNPDLKPETAQIFTAGLVVEPRVLKDFSVTVDYYNIAVKNSITSIGADQILASCYPSVTGVVPQFCEKVLRDSSSHTITNILNPLTNVGGDFTSGIDVGARYEPETPVGRILIDGDVSWLGVFDSLLAGNANTKYGRGTLIEGKGNYDLGVHPDWVGNAGVTWALDPLRVGVRGRFVGPFKECGDSDGVAAGGGGICHQDDPTAPPPYSRTVLPYYTVDANVSWTLNSGLGTSTIAAGVNNLLNVEPARVYNGFAANSETAAYDYMMRYFYARLTHKF